jgi:hypothetical protein
MVTPTPQGLAAATGPSGGPEPASSAAARHMQGQARMTSSKPSCHDVSITGGVITAVHTGMVVMLVRRALGPPRQGSQPVQQLKHA